MQRFVRTNARQCIEFQFKAFEHFCTTLVNGGWMPKGISGVVTRKIFFPWNTPFRGIPSQIQQKHGVHVIWQWKCRKKRDEQQFSLKTTESKRNVYFDSHCAICSKCSLYMFECDPNPLAFPSPNNELTQPNHTQQYHSLCVWAWGPKR